MRLLIDRLPDFLSYIGEADLKDAREIRVRQGQRVEIRKARGGALVGEAVTSAQMRQLVGALTGHSLYAMEAQMRDGFFSLPGGVRVGLTGRYAEGEDAPIQTVTSIVIRIPRDIRDAGRAVSPFVFCEEGVKNTLILSPPCLGKTTLLRAMIREASSCGLSVAVSDERDELAGLIDLGERTDVAALAPKRVAIMRMLRSMAPDVIATDELGHAGDCEAVEEAARCGVAVIATAHASGYQAALSRPSMRSIMASGVFARVVELGGAPGRVRRILNAEGDELWTAGR